MSFVLPELPYERDALAPHISRETIDFHYGKHHAGYVTKLNGMVKDTFWNDKALEEIIASADGGLFNNAAQIWNHTFYWQSMCANGGAEPTGLLKKRIEESFESVANFKKEFSAAASGLFGSGWAWLILTTDNRLVIHQSHDAGNPIRDKSGIPLLTCDVWEHAYYIDFRNNRPAYIAAWWNLVNWDFAGKNLIDGMKKLGKLSNV
ncbi:superoxide dismutase SOD2 [Cardiosporidium cionae]|uniref:Superoxide dismutase n=1 Tax=Cardiosporidium cionae TaxID=476202 RepID=A0A3Q8UBI5_9APIC|nr:superoxide dismutase [Cardiosporidium cionae]KAF8821878.1 superoxide dismutase SOD2 [Cardiosporidium cionae]|eukprot:KAF8821878.1 superoxide dismutase SOD2 [Cardiosporidium cionae]